MIGYSLKPFLNCSNMFFFGGQSTPLHLFDEGQFIAPFSAGWSPQIDSFLQGESPKNAGQGFGIFIFFGSWFGFNAMIHTLVVVDRLIGERNHPASCRLFHSPKTNSNSPLKMDGWNTNSFPFWGVRSAYYFQVRELVNFREISQFFSLDPIIHQPVNSIYLGNL